MRCTAPSRASAPSAVLPVVAVAFSFLAFACTGEDEGDPDAFRTEVDTTDGVPHVLNHGDPPEWTLTHVFALGGVAAGDTVEQFGSVRSVVADAGGRLYVSDLVVDAVRVFGPDGAFERTLGREGEGPGEYLNPYGVGLLGDTAVVVDPGNVRLGMFDADGAWLGQMPYPPITGGNRVFQTAPAEFWVTSMRRWDDEIELTWVRYTGDGPVDTTHARPERPSEPENYVECRAEGSIHFHQAEIAPNYVRVPGPDGLVIEPEPVGYRLHFLTTDGDTVRVVERVTDDVFVSDAEWSRELEAFDAFMADVPPARCEPSGLSRPERERLIDAVFTDPHGRVWVEQRMDETSEDAGFDVFDREGALLATLRGPARSPRALPFARDGRFYVVTTDSLDVPVVRAFDIQR